MQNFGNMLIRFQMRMHNTNYSWKSTQQSNFDRVFCQHIVLIMFYLNPTGTMNYIISLYANYLSYSFIITISWISITKKGESSWSQLDSNEHEPLHILAKQIYQIWLTILSSQAILHCVCAHTG